MTCGGWGGYARATLSNIKCRIFPLCHKGAACDTGCETGSCETDCNGIDGISTSSITPLEPTVVQQTSYPRTER